MTEQNPQAMKHVVIVGGGFAGLNCARKLASNPNVRITLLDKNNYHQFQPLLYQVATSTLSPDNIAFNLRFTLLHHPNVEVKMTEVVSIDLNSRTVETAHGQRYQGDYLVLAAGSQANFFGTPGAQENSYPLYSLHDAERLRSRILAMLESAERDPSLAAKGALNSVIVGGGPTGAEMAGAFGDMLQLALKKKREERALQRYRRGACADFPGGWRPRSVKCLFPCVAGICRPKCSRNEVCKCSAYKSQRDREWACAAFRWHPRSRRTL